MCSLHCLETLYRRASRREFVKKGLMAATAVACALVRYPGGCGEAGELYDRPRPDAHFIQTSRAVFLLKMPG
jgi:hypothetical protein